MFGKSSCILLWSWGHPKKYVGDVVVSENDVGDDVVGWNDVEDVVVGSNDIGDVIVGGNDIGDVTGHEPIASPYVEYEQGDANMGDIRDMTLDENNVGDAITVTPLGDGGDLVRWPGKGDVRANMPSGVN
ncbi:hypothetical protein Sjap_023699 [Stephania japonica]|uniref:Uncharacterized protein n=1 Tax=Stephania japonica TaxID=461633 RepID=A0AAP0HMZ0_9MAGN